jgi:hypothetical protein
LLGSPAKAEPGFIKNLAAEDFTAAGLPRLTPAELARLDALIQQYMTGEVAAARREVEAQITADEQKVCEARAKAKASAVERQAKEAEAKAAAPPGKKTPGWFNALLTLKRAGEAPETAEPLASRLVGEFNGWSGHTVFLLENGTQWVQQNRNETYAYSPTVHSPTVKITPATISGFWLEIKGVNRGVRVVPLKLTDQK